jgi:hypothetical protein
MFPSEHEIFLCSKSLRSVLGPTQPAIDEYWELYPGGGELSCRRRYVDHWSPSRADVKDDKDIYVLRHIT